VEEIIPEAKPMEGLHIQEVEGLIQDGGDREQIKEDPSCLEKTFDGAAGIPVSEPTGMQQDPVNLSLNPESNVDFMTMGTPPINRCNDDLLNIDNLTAAIPSIELNCEDGSHVSLEPSSSPPVRHYNLRSLRKKPNSNPEILESVGGLGTVSSRSFKKKVRGRKSNLSKAQVKAKFDMADGKQLSIPGALRAAVTPEAIIK